MHAFSSQLTEQSILSCNPDTETFVNKCWEKKNVKNKHFSFSPAMLKELKE